MVTRVDYERTASVLKGALARYRPGEGHECHVSAIANDFAAVFKADNPRFDKAKFREACGLPPNG